MHKTLSLILKKENLEEFLNNMTDKEIVFFSTYRQAEFMPESQEKIKAELKEKGFREITSNQFNKSIRKNNS